MNIFFNIFIKKFKIMSGIYIVSLISNLQDKVEISKKDVRPAIDSGRSREITTKNDLKTS